MKWIKKRKKTMYSCPLCNSNLMSTPGSANNPNDGVTLYCENRGCPAQEVSGHGIDAADAYEVILFKFGENALTKTKN